VADLESDGARLKAELVLESPDQAADLVSAGRLVLDKLLGDHASKLELRADAERVLLDARMSRSELVALFTRARGG
jgi:hypothetical protein